MTLYLACVTLYLGLICFVTNLVRCVLDWLWDNLGYLMLGFLCLVLEVINCIACLVLGISGVVLGLLLGVVKLVLILIALCVLVLQQQTGSFAINLSSRMKQV